MNQVLVMISFRFLVMGAIEGPPLVSEREKCISARQRFYMMSGEWP